MYLEILINNKKISFQQTQLLILYEMCNYKAVKDSKSQ